MLLLWTISPFHLRSVFELELFDSVDRIVFSDHWFLCEILHLRNRLTFWLRWSFANRWEISSIVLDGVPPKRGFLG